jgi:hypothetical protein
MLTTPHETPSAYPGHMRTIKNFINLIAFGFFILMMFIRPQGLFAR